MRVEQTNLLAHHIRETSNVKPFPGLTSEDIVYVFLVAGKHDNRFSSGRKGGFLLHPPLQVLRFRTKLRDTCLSAV